jgi:hypothetical protein
MAQTMSSSVGFKGPVVRPCMALSTALMMLVVTLDPAGGQHIW